MSEKEKVFKILSSLEEFHEKLKLSIGKVCVNFSSLPFFYGFKGICQGSVELYSYDVINILLALQEHIKDETLL